MCDRPDLDRFVEEEAADFRRRSAFARWSRPRRHVVALGLATLVLACGAALLLLLSWAGPDPLPVWLVLVVLLSVAAYLYRHALRMARDPEGQVRRSAREMGSYPTSAPGLRSPEVGPGDRQEDPEP